MSYYFMSFKYEIIFMILSCDTYINVISYYLFKKYLFKKYLGNVTSFKYEVISMLCKDDQLLLEYSIYKQNNIS